MFVSSPHLGKLEIIIPDLELLNPLLRGDVAGRQDLVVGLEPQKSLTQALLALDELFVGTPGQFFGEDPFGQFRFEHFGVRVFLLRKKIRVARMKCWL